MVLVRRLRDLRRLGAHQHSGVVKLHPRPRLGQRGVVGIERALDVASLATTLHVHPLCQWRGGRFVRSGAVQLLGRLRSRRPKSRWVASGQKSVGRTVPQTTKQKKKQKNVGRGAVSQSALKRALADGAMRAHPRRRGTRHLLQELHALGGLQLDPATAPRRSGGAAAAAAY
jgi:hypothetical protein